MKNEYKLLVCLTLLISCLTLSSCGVLQQKIDGYLRDKEICILNNENITQFTYQLKSYTILEEVLSDKDIGSWVGIIRKIIAVDDNGKIIKQADATNINTNYLSNFAKDLDKDVHTIQIFDVYKKTGTDGVLIVIVNGRPHKAVLTDRINSDEKIFDFKKYIKNQSADFEINSHNATQLIYKDRIYQVSTQVVPEDYLEDFIGVIAKKVEFDAYTKEPLTKDELKKIDWQGTAHSKREIWFYLDVYTISGIELKDGFAVKVNNQYVKTTSK